jgi:hypothetical protein
MDLSTMKSLRSNQQSAKDTHQLEKSRQWAEQIFMARKGDKSRDFKKKS